MHGPLNVKSHTEVPKVMNNASLGRSSHYADRNYFAAAVARVIVQC